jgi:hypothetical protein
MKNRKNIKYSLLILCILVLVIPWGFVFGVKNEALNRQIGIFQRSAGLVILTPIIVAIIYKVFKLKTVEQEIKERETNKNDQKDGGEKQFKPPLIIMVVILFMLFIGVSSLFLPEHPGDDKGAKFFISGFPIAFSLWMWYTSLVFTFREDYLQIESAFFHFFHINRNKIFKYEDITHAKIERIPRAPYEMYALFISTNKEKKKRYPLFLNDDAVAKINLLFKKKIGDRVKSF